MVFHDLFLLADYINSCDDYPVDVVNESISSNGWIDMQHFQFDICLSVSDRLSLVLNDDGKAEVIRLPF